MAEGLNVLKRTNMCGQLTEKDIGKKVVVAGWCHKQRDLGKLLFITLRDRSGLIQLVANESAPSEVFEIMSEIRSEYVLAAKGTVSRRSSPNPELPTGNIEIAIEEIKILSESKTPPFYIEESSDTKESLRLKYRYLDLRRPDMQKKLISRHRITKCARDYFDEKGFLEIETPMLTKSTPEGARDYLVPSRVHPGKFFALPQSPQLFKQLLMLSGYDRYMQIARCFRDEDLRADRQPEFTQIDLEMSFVDADDVLNVNEGFMARLFKEILDVDVKLPMRRMAYKEAMERFGSDKPDLRFGIELKDISDITKQTEFKVFKNALDSGGSVRLINVPGKADLTRKEIDSLTDFVKTYGAKGLIWITCEDTPRGSILKFLDDDVLKNIYKRAQCSNGDIMFIVADDDETVFASLGALRCEIAKRCDIIKDERYEFLWVTDFPLFEYNHEEGRYEAKHHPFTAPVDEDIRLLDGDPIKARAKAYDLVLNGCELGGGSIRIHDQKLQKRMFDLLGFSKERAYERFGFLLDAFEYGVPPHGGFAFGLDRLVMLMTHSGSIRDTIAFPKVQNSSCLMTEAPDKVDSKQLFELGIEKMIPREGYDDGQQ